MSDNLDFLLRKALRSGLNYLSLSPNNVNPKAGKWSAAYRHAGNSNCQYVDSDDPVEAIEKAIRRGEAEFKSHRDYQENVAKPLAEHTRKLQRKNLGKVAAVQQEKEAAATKRRRDLDDLV